MGFTFENKDETFIFFYLPDPYRIQKLSMSILILIEI